MPASRGRRRVRAAAGRRLLDRRIRLMLACTLAAFCVVLVRASYLQAVQSHRLDEIATGQQRKVHVLPSTRGVLVDRDGRTLATSEQATTIGAYTHLVRDPESLAQALSPLLGVDAATLRARLADRSVLHIDLARQVDPRVADRIRARGLGAGALDFRPEQRRVYPEGSVGAQVIGFAGLDNRGIAGAELQFDRLLEPKPGKDVVLEDPTGRTLRVLEHRSGVPGHDVQLTLDSAIQAQAEQVVAETQQRWQARSATAIVLDPKTGGILAMASAPGIPPGRGYGGATNAERKIRAISDQYEPGSTFKVVTIGAALETGKVTPDTPFVIPPYIHRYDRTVWDAEHHPTETMTVSSILAHSSNVGAITIAWYVLTQRVFDAWTHRLGFGKPTGVDLPGELPGSVLPFKDWSGTSILNIPIGEGIAVTPLQMAALYAAIANHGVWKQPHVLERIDGRPRPPVRSRRLFSRATAAELVSMLQGVVADGTGVEAQIPGYTVAGKTGTTQKVDPRTGTYCGVNGARCMYDGSFVGFIPARHPQAVVLVLVDDPKGQYYGGTVAAPAFREIGANVLHVLGVRPDAPQTQTQTQPAG